MKMRRLVLIREARWGALAGALLCCVFSTSQAHARKNALDAPTKTGRYEDVVELRLMDGLRPLSNTWWGMLAGQTPSGSIATKSGRLYADTDHTIRIRFDESRLLESDLFSSGKVSLAATLDGIPVQVEGYSEVGKDRTAVGLTGQSPKGFLLDVIEMQAQLHGLVAVETDTLKDWQFMRSAERLGNILPGFFMDRSTAEAFFYALNVSPAFVLSELEEVQSVLGQYGRELSAGQVQDAVGKVDRTRRAAELQAVADSLRDKKGRVLNQFYEIQRRLESEVVATKRSAPGSEEDKARETRLSQLRFQFAAVGDAIRKIDRDTATNYELLEEFRLSAEGAIQKRYRALLLKSFIDIEKQVNREIDAKVWTGPDTEDGLKRFWFTNAQGEDDYRFKVARRQIYRNLVEGQISLRSIGARRGQVLSIKMLFFQDENMEALSKEGVTRGLGKPSEFTVADVYVIEGGFHRRVRDSFLLVKRIRQPAGSDVSPSNFKGAPGAALTWERTSIPEDGWFLAGISKLLTVGLDVSFLDFNTTKDVEVGVGPILGLFGDQVHIAYGWNLNDGGYRHGKYWALGFSFANLAEKLVGGKKPAE